MIQTSRLPLYSVLVIIVSLFFVQCDDGPGTSPLPDNDNQLLSVSVSPQQVVFVAEDGAKDTTVSLLITVTPREGVSFQENPVATLRYQSSPQNFAQDTLSRQQDNTYQGVLQFTQSTAQSAVLNVMTRGIDENGNPTNTLRTNIEVSGYSASDPVVSDVFTPDTAFIPSGNNDAFFSIAAKSYHPDGEELISAVNAILTDSTNSSLGEFQLFDDGSNNQVDGGVSGDEFAGDSVYTRSFSLTSNNQPDSVTVKVYSVDISGNHSDTLKSYFLIRR